MAFVKHSTPEIGNWVTTKMTHTNSIGTMQVGTRVRIVGVTERGYDIADGHGNTVREIGWEI